MLQGSMGMGTKSGDFAFNFYKVLKKTNIKYLVIRYSQIKVEIILKLRQGLKTVTGL